VRQFGHSRQVSTQAQLAATCGYLRLLASPFVSAGLYRNPLANEIQDMSALKLVHFFATCVYWPSRKLARAGPFGHST